MSTFLLLLLLFLTTLCRLPLLLLLVNRVFLDLFIAAPAPAAAQLNPVLSIGRLNVAEGLLALKGLLVALPTPADQIFTVASL